MQSVVNGRMPVACAGLIAHPFDPNKISTRGAEGGNIPFGFAVVQGTAWNQGKLPTVNTQKVIGVAAFSNAVESTVGSAAPGYKAKDPMNVLSFGEIWMPYDGTAPTIGATLYVVAAGAAAGKATATSTSNITVPFIARMVDTATALVLVDITAAI